MTIRFIALAGFAAFALAACGGGEDAPSTPEVTEEAAAPEAVATPEIDAGAKLVEVLAAQDDENKARYPYRNPRETLEFFGVEPGMTVVEVLPGGGWYTKILLPYLGAEGKLIGMDYSVDMWSKFGGFADEDFLKAKETWAETWTATTVEDNWSAGAGTDVAAFPYGSRDTSLDGTADVFLMVRVFHHLNRFNSEEKNYMTEALADAHALLKPGGTLGVVQHRGPEGHSDEWASGNNGYMKESAVIAWVEAAGFELIGDSDINANLNDQPTEDDFVWRLPPSLATSRDDEALAAEMRAIGETDRMTLKFRKL